MENIDDENGEVAEDHYVLLDLYMYIKQKGRIAAARAVNNQMTFGDVIFALKGEGILFWRDKRYEKSQHRALEWSEMKEQQQEEKREPLVDQFQNATVPTEIRNKIESLPIEVDDFLWLVTPCARLFLKAFNEENVIPDWTRFVSDLQIFYEESKKDESGNNADYIPILKSANSDRWGVSVCSISGQRFSMGDATVPHSLQSVSKPVTYAIGMAKEGESFMEEWIDVEPAGRPFNTQDLDAATQRPFNASVNSGAIMAAGIVASEKTESTWKEIVDEIRSCWKALCGDDTEIGFSDETYESEKATAYNNFAIAYNIKGRRGLPRNVDLHKMLDVYLGCCSIEITAEALSVAAATLSNGGVCPITGAVIFPSSVVRSVLAETMSCGMYDGAGRFMVEVGLPAKSGVSGALMVIVPGLFGLATFSPRLDSKGNSVRGVDFCKRLVQCYRLHMFEPLDSGKIDPRQNGWRDERQEITNLAWATNVGDDEATRLSNIFLYALCRITQASSDGFTSDKEQIIREKYKKTFAADLDQKRFEEVVKDIKANPEELKFPDGHKYVENAMKEIIFNAVLEIIMVGGSTSISENERRVAMHIAKQNLGINNKVANLEIERHLKQVGNRFSVVDNFNVTDESHYPRESILESCIFGSVTSVAGLPLIEEDAIIEEDAPDQQTRKEEAVQLRKKIKKLGRKLATLVHVSNEPKKRHTIN